MNRKVAGVAGIDMHASHGPWDEAVTLAPVSLVAELQAAGARVVIIPSVAEPVWEPVYDELDEFVLQDDSDFAGWLEREARERGIKTRRTAQVRTWLT